MSFQCFLSQIIFRSCHEEQCEGLEVALFMRVEVRCYEVYNMPLSI